MDILITGALILVVIALIVSAYSFWRASKTRQWKAMCEQLEAEHTEQTQD